MKYTVFFDATLSGQVEIEAVSEQEAKKIFLMKYCRLEEFPEESIEAFNRTVDIIVETERLDKTS